jgi:hypothetical protein
MVAGERNSYKCLSCKAGTYSSAKVGRDSDWGKCARPGALPEGVYILCVLSSHLWTLQTCHLMFSYLNIKTFALMQ